MLGREKFYWKGYRLLVEGFSFVIDLGKDFWEFIVLIGNIKVFMFCLEMD